MKTPNVSPGIKPKITKVSMNQIDDSSKKVFDKRARYRYVIDMNA